VANDDENAADAADPVDGGERPVEQRNAGRLVKDFRKVRVEALALAGGKDDRGKPAHETALRRSTEGSRSTPGGTAAAVFTSGMARRRSLPRSSATTPRTRPFSR